MGFVTLYEAFMGIDPNPDLFRAFFHGRTWSVQGEEEPTPVGRLALQRRSKHDVDYLDYVLADSNRGWHEEWFYIGNLVGDELLAFMGKRLARIKNWG